MTGIPSLNKRDLRESKFVFFFVAQLFPGWLLLWFRNGWQTSGVIVFFPGYFSKKNMDNSVKFSPLSLACIRIILF